MKLLKYLFLAFTVLGLFLSGFLTRVRADIPAEKIQDHKEIKPDWLDKTPTREEIKSVHEVYKPKQSVDDSGKYNTINIDERIDIKRISTVLEQHSNPHATEMES